MAISHQLTGQTQEQIIPQLKERKLNEKLLELIQNDEETYEQFINAFNEDRIVLINTVISILDKKNNILKKLLRILGLGGRRGAGG